MPVDASKRLEALRSLMSQEQIDYYFVPAKDVHNNEYVPAHWQRRACISQFTGSAGDALIGLESAYLWTDARYFLQAEEQLDSRHFTLMKQQQGTIPIPAWIGEHAGGKRIGVDPQVLSLNEQRAWQTSIDANGGELVSLPQNLIDTIWDNQPTLTTHEIHKYELTFAGQSVSDKLRAVREALKVQRVDAHAMNLLDAIAWLFNIRGQDVDFNPLALSFALITDSRAILFAHINQVSPKLKEQLQEEGVEVLPYADFANTLQQLRGRVLLEPQTANWWMHQQLQDATCVLGNSPITLMKAIKNETEQQGAYTAHEHDGIALTKTFYWLEQQWQHQTELSVSEKVREFRLSNPACKDLSFNSISSYGAHGAINHYAVTEESSVPLGDESLFLLDSGAQYYEGTTDVTRTVHFGTPSADHIKHYTLVLKGHLALRSAIFPHGTCGEHLDVLAHHALWEQGIDYGHGTGHGVGAYLCVHEGPQRISRGQTNVPLVPGMIVSNEPGIYFDGKYGIRIENLIVVVEKFTPEQSATHHGPFYGFDDLTLFPYARNLIDKARLSTQEIEQIDRYHERVYQTLCDNLSDELKAWLRKATLPL